MIQSKIQACYNFWFYLNYFITVCDMLILSTYACVYLHESDYLHIHVDIKTTWIYLFCFCPLFLSLPIPSMYSLSFSPKLALFFVQLSNSAVCPHVHLSHLNLSLVCFQFNISSKEDPVRVKMLGPLNFYIYLPTQDFFCCR